MKHPIDVAPLESFPSIIVFAKHEITTRELFQVLIGCKNVLFFVPTRVIQG